MVKSISKVVFQPDSNSTDEFTVMVHLAEYKKWKEGDTTIPLVEVVDSFQVFFSNQGSQGILGKPSKQQLESVFQTSTDTDVIAQILEKGVEQASEGIKNSASNSTNATKGSAVVDTRGKNLSGAGYSR